MRTDRLTTVLDLAAFVLLALAAGMAFWLAWPPAGPLAAAVVLLVASWFIDRRLEQARSRAEGEGV